MEELSRFRRREEQRALSAQKEYQHTRDFDASQSAPVKLKPSHYALSMPTGLSPLSTPSPRDPFVQLDSTSTNSLSHLAPGSHVSAAKILQQSPPGDTSTESDVNSESVCGNACRAASLRHEVPLDDFLLRRVSLEQHLQQGDAGRDEAMQSFILERFLPAAKIVAADHDRTIYSAGKRRVAGLPSTMQHPSTSISTMKAAPVHSQTSMRSPTLIAPNSVLWSYRPRPCHDEENESVNHELPAKSCGLFCAGLKSAMSRAHNVAHTSTHSMSRTKDRVIQSSSHGTNSDAEVLPPRVKVRMQDTRKQRGEITPVLVSSSSSSPTAATVQDALPRHAASLNKSFARGPAGNTAYSRTHLDSPRLLNLCIKCHSNSSSHQLPIHGPPHEYVRDHNSSGQSLQTLRWIQPCNDISVCCHCDGVKHMLGEYSDNEYNAVVTGEDQDPDRQADMSESPVHHRNVSESASGHQYCPEDDELEFYDAVSKFDMSTSTVSNALPLQKSLSAKFENASVRWSSDEHDLVETHDAYRRKEEILAFDADHDGGLTPPPALKHKCGSVSRCGNDVCAQPRKCADSTSSNLCRMSTPIEPKVASSLPVLGWPLGISSFQTATSRDLRQELTTYDAKMAQEHGRRDGRCETTPDISCTKKASPREGTKDCNKCVVNPSFSMELLSPPLPPSPTMSSWLGKALAMKASKTSCLATLQQEEKVVSAKKKLEFTSPSEVKKGVRWEDVVKGSQMHPEQYSFSEEIRHHHPANQNAMKPLTL